MEVYEIKATLPRSNPLLLRQFTMDAERNLLELGQVLQILLGWKKMWPCSFVDGRNVILPETKLKAAFTGRDGFVCVLGAKGKQENIWEFRLKLLGRKEQEQDYPAIVRFRGENFPQDTASIGQFNVLQQSWDGTMRTYFNSFCNNHPIEQFRFEKKEAERTLRKRFSASATAARSKSPVLELDYKNAVNIEGSFDRMSVEEIRTVARKLGIRVPSGLRKKELISFMVQQMRKKETLDVLLQALTLNQYRALRKICSGQGYVSERGAMQEVYARLAEYGYVEYMPSYYRDMPAIVCTRELLDAYDDWLETADEPQYLRLALLRSTIAACVRLYGCVGKGSWKRVAPKSAKKSYTAQEMDAAWEEMWGNSIAVDLIPGNENLIYGMDKLKPEQAGEAAARLAAMELYAPTIAEIRQLESGGLLYPDSRGRELEEFLRVECKCKKEEAQRIHADIYASLQYGAEPDWYAEWIAPRLELKGRTKLDRLKRMFRVLAPATRMAGFGGYTRLEMERMR